MKKRNFTLDEAHAVLPVVESLLRAAMTGKAQLEEVEDGFKKLNHRIYVNGGMHLDVVTLARRRAESDKLVQKIKDAMAEIESIGAQVKDLDIGLVDFPCNVEGTTILLCWKIGEDKIEHWHGTSEGFGGRRPIDERIRRARQGRDKG